MASAHDMVRILMIRSWTAPLAPFRAALRAAEIEARIIRVDIEPALNAALVRSMIDVVVFDRKTPTITREMVGARMREHRCAAPVVELGDLTSTIEQVRRVLADRIN